MNAVEEPVLEPDIPVRRQVVAHAGHRLDRRDRVAVVDDLLAGGCDIVEVHAEEAGARADIGPQPHPVVGQVDDAVDHSGDAVDAAAARAGRSAAGMDGIDVVVAVVEIELGPEIPAEKERPETVAERAADDVALALGGLKGTGAVGAVRGQVVHVVPAALEPDIRAFGTDAHILSVARRANEGEPQCQGCGTPKFHGIPPGSMRARI